MTTLLASSENPSIGTNEEFTARRLHKTTLNSKSKS
jgi:hypothetical protein